MADYSKIAGLMKSDWDRRINHDYRFWMSDGYSSDDAMWAAGKRDLEILVGDLQELNRKTVLDLGCGVGRLLKSAMERFQKVIGIDVSEKAIQKASELLGAHPALELVRGSGIDLQPVPDRSVDVVISFAALCSTPAVVFAQYLLEVNRVLKDHGVARLQIYFGKEQQAYQEDTLQLRCYEEQRFVSAAAECGLTAEWSEELKLPLQVSFEELGIRAMVVSLQKTGLPKLNAEQVLKILLPQGEKAASSENKDLEYWMTVNYAEELVEKGEIDQARKTLEYAANVSKAAAIDVTDILDRIVKKLEERRGTAPHIEVRTEADRIYDDNLACVQAMFPDACAMLSSVTSEALAQVEVKQTGEGPVLFVAGTCLDHPQKPRAAAEKWVRTLQGESQAAQPKGTLLVGLGGGYHLQALLEQRESPRSSLPLAVVEPNPAVFKMLLRSRPCGDWLRKLSFLAVGESEAFPPETFEYDLWMRPQAQALHSSLCSRLRARVYGRRGLSLLQPTFGVVGPFQGGTLPIMTYVTRALMMLGQRVRQYDLSCFNGGFGQLEGFVKAPERRTGLENTYYEMVSQVVLESIAEKPVDVLICMALAPVSPRVLAELRKRGVITVLWFVEDYQRFTYWQNYAAGFDFIFAIQKGACIEAMKKAGAGEVHYLPVGCDREVHAPLQLGDEERARWGSPISFVGAGYHNRQQLFASLADFPLKIWGTEWPTCRPFDRLVQEGGRRLTPGEYVKVFNASDININLHSSTERDGVDPFGDFLNPRTFELAAAGAFQLVDHRQLLPEAFEAGKEVIAFSNGKELKAQIEYYLNRPEERRRVAMLGRERALKDHTYDKRIAQMLSIVYSAKFEQLKHRLDSSPWKKTLQRAKPHPELHERCMQAFQRGEEPNLDGLVSDIISGHGKLTDTEQKLLFLYHVRKQIIRRAVQDAGGS